MPSNPPTISDLSDQVVDEVGLFLADAGLYLRSADGASTPAILRGLREGFKACGYTLANPLVPTDSDAAALSSFAMERVLQHGALLALQWVSLNWGRVTQKHQEALSSATVVSGFLVDERRAIERRIGELKAICNEPFREPTDQAVVMPSRFGGSTPTPAQGTPPDLSRSSAYPYGPYGYGYGYGPWGRDGCP